MGLRMQLRSHEPMKIIPLTLADLPATVLGREYAGRIAASGSRREAARRAVEAVYAPKLRFANDQDRMQRVVAKVYTRSELERLMINAFGALGLPE
jgi:hypothetical protein